MVWCGRQRGPYLALLHEGSAGAYALGELFKQRVYGKSLAARQAWIDVGGRSGLFAIIALWAGVAQVYSGEPHLGTAQLAATAVRDATISGHIQAHGVWSMREHARAWAGRGHAEKSYCLATPEEFIAAGARSRRLGNRPRSLYFPWVAAYV